MAIGPVQLIVLDRAVPLRDAIARAGGSRLGDGFIGPLDLVGTGLLPATEAEQLHAAERPAVSRS